MAIDLHIVRRVGERERGLAAFEEARITRCFDRAAAEEAMLAQAPHVAGCGSRKFDPAGLAQ